MDEEEKKGGNKATDRVSGVWAVYNTVRYFIAYADHASMQAQTIALALGTCTALSTCFLAASFVLTLTRTSLVDCGVSLKLALAIDTTLHLLASLALISPTIVNVVLVFIWRTAADTDVRFSGRCRLDMDVVWTSANNCSGSLWGVWLALAFIRLVLTITLLVSL